MKWVAHKITSKNGEEVYQSLQEHLFNVAEHCMAIGERIGLKYTSYCIGLMHDYGKSGELFQDYIVEDKNIHVNHSSAGGSYIYNKLKNSTDQANLLPGEIMAYIIFAHHGLFDTLNSTMDELNFSKRLNFNKNNEYNEEDYKEFREVALEPLLKERMGMTLDELIERSSLELQNMLDRARELAINTSSELKYKNKALFYYRGLIVRLLLSILKEGDIYDSANAFLEKKDPLIKEEDLKELWNNGVRLIESKYEGFSKSEEKGKLDKIRTKLSEEGKRKAYEIESGSIKAELPTGSGKTLLTTRFALHNCQKFNKKKFIYITSFLSVLEQNAKEIKGIINNDEKVLEHHSNVVLEKENNSGQKENDYYNDKKEYYLNQYLMESWESPIILTTMVQFMNTLFKGRASNIRRFCKLIDSVIVMDEIQNIPIKMVNHFSLMNNFLTEIMKATIIHTTATQPELESNALEFNTIYRKEDNGHLSELTVDDNEVFKRVKAFYLKQREKESLSIKDLVNHVEEQVQEHNSILIIANTKKAVHKIYQEMKSFENKGFTVYELTTNQCAKHRLMKIEIIKQNLKDKEKVILVSSSLIEAGVDVDFNIVYRTLAGISSLVQAMGRCNREGELDYGLFFILKLEEEILGSLKDIRYEQKRSAMCLENISDSEVNIDSLKNKYYDRLYHNNEDKFYAIKVGDSWTTLLEILSDNEALVRERIDTHKKPVYFIRQNYKTASRAFQMIEETGESVVVTISEELSNKMLEKLPEKILEEFLKKIKDLPNIHLIEDYRDALENFDYPKAKSIMKELQPYTINIRDIHKHERVVEVINDTYILLEHHYDEEIGFNDKELETLII